MTPPTSFMPHLFAPPTSDELDRWRARLLAADIRAGLPSDLPIAIDVYPTARGAVALARQWYRFGQGCSDTPRHKLLEIIALVEQPEHVVIPNGQHIPVWYAPTHRGDDNFHVIVPPGRPTDPFLAIEYGCDHQYTNRIIGSLAYRNTCTTCGFSYVVDHGD